MAGGPYTDRNGSKYLKWSNKRLHPEQPKVREELRTKKAGEAHKRKHRLEELYQIGKHDPWKQKWYDNPSIKPFVTSSLLSGNIDDIRTGTDINLFDAAESYIAWQLNRPRGWNSDTTRHLYPQVIRFFVKAFGEHRNLSSITKKEIEKVLFKDHSDETIKGNRAKLKAFFNYCVKQGWIDKSPEIETPAPEKKLPKFFYDLQFLECCWYKIHQVQQTLKNMGINDGKHQLRFVLAWMLQAGTGMRPDEAINIRMEDVHGDQIMVGASKTTKTNSQRMVPILYEAKSAVSVLTDPNYRNLDRNLANSNYLLGIESQRAKERSSTELRDSWKAVVGKGKRTAYNLRDYFAVRFLTDASGNPDFRLLQLRNILGHTSLSTTEKYLKAVPGNLDLSIPKDTELLQILSDISARVPK